MGFFRRSHYQHARIPTHGGKYQPLLTRAKMKKSRTALIEPVERSILMMSTHLPFIGGGLSSGPGPSQNRRAGVLGRLVGYFLSQPLREIILPLENSYEEKGDHKNHDDEVSD